MNAVALVLLTLFGNVHGYRVSTSILRRSIHPNAAIISPRMVVIGLRMAIDDDEKPKISMQEENDGPRIDVKSLEETMIGRKENYLSSVNYGNAVIETKSEMKTTATFGTMSVEDLKKRMIPRDLPQKNVFDRPKEDLNGIQPMTPLLWSVFPAVFCVIFWQLTVYMTNHFAITFISSDMYPVRRFASLARNFVVGFTTLASGFTGVASIIILSNPPPNLNLTLIRTLVFLVQ